MFGRKTKMHRSPKRPAKKAVKTETTNKEEVSQSDTIAVVQTGTLSNVPTLETNRRKIVKTEEDS